LLQLQQQGLQLAAGVQWGRLEQVRQQLEEDDVAAQQLWQQQQQRKLNMTAVIMMRETQLGFCPQRTGRSAERQTTLQQKQQQQQQQQQQRLRQRGLPHQIL
jgi:hypothetical protein